jgi:hypothetical protein
MLFGLSGPTLARFHTSADVHGEPIPEDRAKKALTMVVQEHVADVLSNGETLRPEAEISPSEIERAIVYAKSGGPLDVSLEPDFLLCEVDRS